MTLSTQFLTMVSMAIMGSLFGIMLDTYQRFLNRPHRKHWIVFINDILFWSIQAVLIFYTLFKVNNGELRFYIFLAILCGFAAYQSLIKGIYLRLLEILIITVISIARFIGNMLKQIVYRPVVGLVQLIIFILLFLGRGLYTLVKFVLRVLLFILNNIIWFVLKKILQVLWKLLPKGIKKTVEKLYNKTAGNFKIIKNSFSKFINKWKKPKE